MRRSGSAGRALPGPAAQLISVREAREMRARAASSVFSSSIAMVIGPTPPGTGVIAEAIAEADSNSTS